MHRNEFICNNMHVADPFPNSNLLGYSCISSKLNTTCMAPAPRTSWQVLVLKNFNISTTRWTTSEDRAGKKWFISMYSDNIFSNIKPLQKQHEKKIKSYQNLFMVKFSFCLTNHYIIRIKLKCWQKNLNSVIQSMTGETKFKYQNAHR